MDTADGYPIGQNSLDKTWINLKCNTQVSKVINLLASTSKNLWSAWGDAFSWLPLYCFNLITGFTAAAIVFSTVNLACISQNNISARVPVRETLESYCLVHQFVICFIHFSMFNILIWHSLINKPFNKACQSWTLGLRQIFYLNPEDQTWKCMMKLFWYEFLKHVAGALLFLRFNDGSLQWWSSSLSFSKEYRKQLFSDLGIWPHLSLFSWTRPGSANVVAQALGLTVFNLCLVTHGNKSSVYILGGGHSLRLNQPTRLAEQKGPGERAPERMGPSNCLQFQTNRCLRVPSLLWSDRGSPIAAEAGRFTSGVPVQLWLVGLSSRHSSTIKYPYLKGLWAFCLDVALERACALVRCWPTWAYAVEM